MTTQTRPVSRLQEVADQLVKTFTAKATSNQSYFVNEIPGHLQLNRDPQVIASVLSGLLTTHVASCHGSSFKSNRGEDLV